MTSLGFEVNVLEEVSRRFSLLHAELFIRSEDDEAELRLRRRNALILSSVSNCIVRFLSWHMCL
jgi:hypothetical protein